jgi:hypothetical protein
MVYVSYFDIGRAGRDAGLIKDDKITPTFESEQPEAESNQP